MPRGYVSEQHYGVVIFDNLTVVQNGWACISGGNPFYVTSIGDLDANTIWLTNIDASILFQKGLSRNSNLRPEGYLRTKLSSLLIELGLRALPSGIQAKVLSDIFSTIMQFYCLNTGLINAPERLLNNGVRRAFLPEEQPITREVLNAASSAVNAHILKEKVHETDDSGLVSLLFHRYEYAQDILSRELPIGRWERVSSLILKERKAFLSEWLNELRMPALVKVAIKSVSENIDHLVNYGYRANLPFDKSKSDNQSPTYNEHAWITSLEYLEMNKYADLQVTDIYTGQGYGYSPIMIPSWG